MLLQEILKDHSLEYLYYIAPIDNLLPILDRGVLSYNKAKNFPHKDFSNSKVQNRREHPFSYNKKLDRKIYIHDWVPLFISTKTPLFSMLLTTPLIISPLW